MSSAKVTITKIEFEGTFEEVQQLVGFGATLNSDVNLQVEPAKEQPKVEPAKEQPKVESSKPAPLFGGSEKPAPVDVKPIEVPAKVDAPKALFSGNSTEDEVDNGETHEADTSDPWSSEVISWAWEQIGKLKVGPKQTEAYNGFIALLGKRPTDSDITAFVNAAVK